MMPFHRLNNGEQAGAGQALLRAEILKKHLNFNTVRVRGHTLGRACSP